MELYGTSDRRHQQHDRTVGRYWVCVLLCLATISLGCKQVSEETVTVQTRLSRLGTFYGMYIGKKAGSTPKTLDDLKAFAAERTTPEELERLGVTDIDALFTSPRDGLPFKMVKYRVPPPPPMGEPVPIVLYEAEGKDGERAVGLLGGGTELLDEATLEERLPEGLK